VSVTPAALRCSGYPEKSLLDPDMIALAPGVVQLQGCDDRNCQRGDEFRAGVDVSRPVGWVRSRLVIHDEHDFLDAGSA
jgi:hypothetical protein